MTLNILKHIIYIGILAGFGFSFSDAAYEHSPHSAENAALGFIRLNFSTNSPVTILDPSSLPHHLTYGLSVIGGRKFNLKNISHKSGSLVIPSRIGHWGFALGSLGDQRYSETRSALSWGKRFNRRVQAG